MSLPVLVEDGCSNWDAIDKWQNLSYIAEEFGNKTLQIHRLDNLVEGGSIDLSALMETGGQTLTTSGLGVSSGRKNTFFDFINRIDSEKLKNGKYQYYIKNELLLSKSLSADFIRPEFISKVLRARHTGLTVWPDFANTNGQAVRRPEVRDRERYVCVVKGSEEFRLVSPVYKQNIYSGVLEELSPNETPLDFFRQVNETRFPLFQEAKVLSVEVPQGSCLFIPAFYWS